MFLCTIRRISLKGEGKSETPPSETSSVVVESDASDVIHRDDASTGRGMKRIPSEGSLDERSTTLRCIEETTQDDDKALDLLLDFDVVSEWSLNYLHEYLDVPKPVGSCLAKPCITVR